MRHRDINLGLDRLFFVISELDLKVQLNELFGILWSTLHRLSGHRHAATALSAIPGRTASTSLYRSRRRVEYTRSLLGEASQALEGRLLLVFLLLGEDQIADIGSFENVGGVHFEVRAEKGTSVVRNLEVIDLRRLFVEVVHHKCIVDDLHPDQRLWRENDLPLESVDK